LSQKQIGHQFGVSQMQVSRLLSSILARLRDELGVTYTPAAS
ncbi:MAG: sigma factor-like helix-turn-helix DNA-binding protein, partial [Candidatus Phosphoribacter sp.]